MKNIEYFTRSLAILIFIAIGIITTNCSRGLPPVKKMDLIEISSGSKEVSFSLHTPKRQPSQGYWRYKLAMIPSNKTPPTGGIIEVECLLDGIKRKYFFNSFEESSWNKPQISFLLNISDEIFEDDKNYNVKFIFNESTNQNVKLVLHYLSN